jgi:hypothetical protein
MLDDGRCDVSETHAGTNACHATRLESRDATDRGVAGYLALAAAPTFAIMALLTGVSAGDPMDMLCSAAHGASPLNGMALMYVLMSVFHGAPWLRWIATRRRQRVLTNEG